MHVLTPMRDSVAAVQARAHAAELAVDLARWRPQDEAADGIPAHNQATQNSCAMLVHLFPATCCPTKALCETACCMCACS